jgi:glycosyltransferase involved in cell wall biosynthesis
LSSVLSVIDYWVIVDTGSTDGTQELVRTCLSGVRGDLLERPWINFEYNRNVALDLARGKADYILFIDADEVLRWKTPLDKSKLDASFYIIKSQGRDSEHHRIQMIDRDLGWKWIGVIHETIVNYREMSGKVLSNAVIDFSFMDGHRFSNPNKFLNDAAVLEDALRKEPLNARNIFYLAQSYFNSGSYEKALKNFEKRTLQKGEEGEMFFSLYCIGYIHYQMKRASEVIINSYLAAFEFKPKRAEPLERLAHYFYEKKWTLLSYLVAKFAKELSIEVMYNSHALQWVYDYSLDLILADASFVLGWNQESFNLYCNLNQNSKLPKSYYSHVATQMSFLKDRLDCPEKNLCQDMPNVIQKSVLSFRF